jgi:hypothetical protein
VLGGVDSCHEGRALVDRAMLVRPLKVHGRRRATVGARHDGGETEQGTTDDKDRVAQEGGGRRELGCVGVNGEWRSGVRRSAGNGCGDKQT